MIKITFFVLAVWFCITSNAQESGKGIGLSNEIIRSEARIDFDKKKREFYIPPKKRGNWKQLNIEFRADDSISVYLNDSLIYSRWVKHSEVSSASYDAYIPFVVPNNNNQNYMTLVLNKRKKFLKFKLYKKYTCVSAYFLERNRTANDWIIIHGNNMPSE